MAEATSLPDFRYHPNPIHSGSVIESDAECRCCGKSRGYVYTGPVYCEEDLDDDLCPWCIADGAAAKKFDATFVGSEAFGDDTPDEVMEEIMERTPGYCAWQSEVWPSCCGDATAFVMPAGIAEIREQCREHEGSIMSHIVYNMSISGSAATRLLNSLNRDRGPTVYIFRCLKCEAPHFHIDYM